MAAPSADNEGDGAGEWQIWLRKGSIRLEINHQGRQSERQQATQAVAV